MEFRKLKEKIAFKIRGSGKKHFIFTVHSSKIRFGLKFYSPTVTNDN